MMMKSVVFFLALMLVVPVFGQLSIGNGDHNLEFSGMVSTYYNQRFLKSDNNNRNKDRFKLRDAQLQLEGRYKNLYEYELQIDFVDLAAATVGLVDPENPGLMDAYMVYKGLDWFDIKVGYSKLPYSKSSLTPFMFTAFWQRAELVRGDVFSRRDAGLTLMKSMWNQRIQLQAGAYTGLGELSLRGDNDASGGLEYVGRVDFAYPSRFRMRDIDEKVSPIPLFNLGVNARYFNKTQPEGRTLPAFSQGEYGIKVIDGERLAYGFDLSMMYKGFSAQFEIHQLRFTPNNGQGLQGLDPSISEGYFLAGGYFAQTNYFAKSWKSVFSARFEELDLNDLVPGNSHRLSVAYAYQLRGWNSMLKIQYFGILKEELPIDPLRWTEQVRLGWQYAFR